MATSYKILGQAAPANTSNTDLYTVGAAKQTVVSTLVIANIGAATANATIYVRKAGATAANVNTFLKSAPIAVSDLKAITIGITLDATDVITVASSVADTLAFHLFGSEIS